MVNGKVIRGGKVAVLFSPGYGAGWSTWAGSKFEQDYLFHPRWVQWVEEGKKEDPEDVAREIWGQDHEYTCLAGAEQLRIEWLDEDASFVIKCRDGYESIRFRG